MGFGAILPPFFNFFFFHEVLSCCSLTNEIIKENYLRPVPSGIGLGLQIHLLGEFHKIAQNQRLIFNLTLYLTEKLLCFFSFNRIIKTANENLRHN